MATVSAWGTNTTERVIAARTRPDTGCRRSLTLQALAVFHRWLSCEEPRVDVLHCASVLIAQVAAARAFVARLPKNALSCRWALSMVLNCIHGLGQVSDQIELSLVHPGCSDTLPVSAGLLHLSGQSMTCVIGRLHRWPSGTVDSKISGFLIEYTSTTLICLGYSASDAAAHHWNMQNTCRGAHHQLQFVSQHQQRARSVSVLAIKGRPARSREERFCPLWTALVMPSRRQKPWQTASRMLVRRQQSRRSRHSQSRCTPHA
jgi:hypothetical protein